MKTKKNILLSAIASLLPAYAVLYFIGVSPDSPPADEAYIKYSRGWNPSYPYYENQWSEPLSDTPMKMRWNNYVHIFFTPIHRIDRIIRRDLWLSSEEKQELTLRASQPLVAPLQIYKTSFILDGGSIVIEGVDKNLTGFRIKLYRTIKIRREGLPQIITVNDRELEYGGSEEQQLATHLNDWLDNISADAPGNVTRHIEEVKEAVDTISNRT